MRRKAIVLPCVLSGLLLAPAAAWSSPPCECELAFLLPTDGATAVPTNGRVLVSHPDVDPATLALSTDDATGAAVPITVTPAGSVPYQVWVVPDADLAPGTAYRLEAQYTGGGGTLSHGFTTGSGPDTVAPTLGVATVAPASSLGACEDLRAAQVTLVGASDDQTPDDALIVQVSAYEVGVDGLPHVLFLPTWYGVFGDSGNGSCLTNFAGVESGTDYSATVTVMDWAGNLAPEASPQTFRFATIDAGGCGCRGAGSGEGAGLLLLVAVDLLWWRRRR